MGGLWPASLFAAIGELGSGRQVRAEPVTRLPAGGFETLGVGLEMAAGQDDEFLGLVKAAMASGLCNHGDHDPGLSAEAGEAVGVELHALARLVMEKLELVLDLCLGPAADLTDAFAVQGYRAAPSSWAAVKWFYQQLQSLHAADDGLISPPACSPSCSPTGRPSPLTPPRYGTGGLLQAHDWQAAQSGSLHCVCRVPDEAGGR
jgi:hypothetical protein